MDNSEWVQYKTEVRERLRLFILKILELSELFPHSERARIINRQLTRSGTSTYANYMAALRGRSKAEFFSKLSIAVEEADETEMWLDLAICAKIVTEKPVKKMHSESLEIVKILASMRKRTGNNQSNSITSI